MSADQRPIAWLALSKGTPVHASGGDEIGKVAQVVGDVSKDIFSGITFRSNLLATERFAPAELVAQITEGAVRLSISSDEAERLAAYEA